MTDEKLQRLEKLISLLDETPTKEEFVKAFEAVTAYVKQIDERTAKDVETLASSLAQFVEKVKGDTSSSLEDIKGQVDQVFVGERVGKMEMSHGEKMQEMQDMFDRIEEKLKTVKNGRDGENGLRGVDGKTPTKEQLISLIEPLIPKIEDIVSKVPQRVQTPAKSFQIRKTDVSSQCDGANKTFSVGGTHFGIMGVFSTQFPIIYRPVIDYTETKTGILLTDEVGAPQTGQTLVIQFLK